MVCVMQRDYGTFKDRIIDKLFSLPAFFLLTALIVKKYAGRGLLIYPVLVNDFYNHLYYDGGRDYVHENSLEDSAA